MLNRRLRAALAGLMSVSALAAAPAVARADLAITGFRAGPALAWNGATGLPFAPTDHANQGLADAACSAVATPTFALAPQAGAVTDFCTGVTFAARDADAGDDVAALTLDLPAGASTAAEAQLHCTAAQFARADPAAAACPAAAQVGTATLRYATTAGGELTVAGRIYATDPAAGKRAALAIAFTAAPDDSVQLKTLAQLAPAPLGDHHDVLQTDDLPRSLPTEQGPQPIAVLGLALRLWGAAAVHPHQSTPFSDDPGPTVTMAADFFALGRICAFAQTARLTVTPSTDTPATAASRAQVASSTYGLTGCDAFPPDDTAAKTSRPVLGSGGRQTLPPVIPYFGTRAFVAHGGPLATLTSIRLVGLPAQTTLTLRCTAGCGPKPRRLVLLTGTDGAAFRRIKPPWLITRAGRFTLKAIAAGFSPTTERYRFRRTRIGVIAKTLG